MALIKATDARSKMYRLIDEVNETHEPLVITGKKSNAVLISVLLCCAGISFPQGISGSG